ncbi:MAG: response regulator transcription factor [Candidatus Dormibacteraeota bacterium]|nr:response regulator transcription factor [Candidatus Dormibacteraeota bacterium]
MASTGPAHLRIAVASEQSLVCEAVRAALTERGLVVSVLRWTGERVPSPRSAATRRLDVGLIISDLDRWNRLQAVALLMTTIRLPWVVLTGAERGPLWGAAAEFGARTVLSSDTPLVVVQDALLAAFRGESLLPREEVELLRASWQELRHERQQLNERVRSLTPREREVLRLLYAGDSVAQIADIFEVSPTTVRSQVKAVLRKLDVKSQLAAVAAFGHLMELDGAR